MKRFLSFKIFLIAFICLILTNAIAQKTAIPNQDPAYLLYTYIDTVAIKKYKDVLRAFDYDPKLLPEYKKFLEPYLNKNDAYAEFLYASCFDLYQYSNGNAEDAKIAFKHYTIAADLHYAEADLFLYNLYRYTFMGVTKDMDKAIFHLKQAGKEGGSVIALKVYSELAGLYYAGESDWEVKPDTSKAIDYLQKVLALDPKDTWAMDYLSSMYEAKGRYEEAFQLSLKSNNSQSKIQAASWLIEGKYVKKDITAGLKILYEEADKILPNYSDYMGSVNPVYYLNELYRCKRLITEQQLGKYKIGFACN